MSFLSAVDVLDDVKELINKSNSSPTGKDGWIIWVLQGETNYLCMWSFSKDMHITIHFLLLAENKYTYY